LCWLGREDSNLRMPASKAGALGHLATPHYFYEHAPIYAQLFGPARVR
jgi:hypothetical protein